MTPKNAKFSYEFDIADGTLIEDVLTEEPKLSIPHTASCFDTKEQLRLSKLDHALVKNTQGSYMGVISLNTLKSLSNTDLHADTVEPHLDKVTDICTPQCCAIQVNNRLLEKQAPYILVVNHSGKLIGFLEARDFVNTPLQKDAN